ncbi:hypothetical protein LZ32DRAFT_420704 [Colletotrichum eremochloae]|nr:hypothetical protein LZ32DRAFT_420704 [Colletotrichum eremochloae]
MNGGRERQWGCDHYLMGRARICGYENRPGLGGGGGVKSGVGDDETLRYRSVDAGYNARPLAALCMENVRITGWKGIRIVVRRRVARRGRWCIVDVKTWNDPNRRTAVAGRVTDERTFLLILLSTLLCCPKRAQCNVITAACAVRGRVRSERVGEREGRWGGVCAA